MFADWGFGERQQQSFVDRRGRTLRGGIELANRVGLVAKKLDAQWTVGFGRVNVENAAPHRVLARHLHHISGGVADGVEVGEQGLKIERFAAAEGAGEACVVIAGPQADGRGRDRRNYYRCRPGRDLP